MDKSRPREILARVRDDSDGDEEGVGIPGDGQAVHADGFGGGFGHGSGGREASGWFPSGSGMR